MLAVAVNIISNLVAVAWLGLGLQGAAATTVATQVCGGACDVCMLWLLVPLLVLPLLSCCGQRARGHLLLSATTQPGIVNSKFTPLYTTALGHCTSDILNELTAVLTVPAGGGCWSAAAGGAGQVHPGA
jgi:hypothetical protein